MLEGPPQQKQESQQEGRESKTTYLERFKRSLKPMLAYGMYALMLFGASETQAQGSQANGDEIEVTASSSENKAKQKEFNYYSPEMFKDFDSFKKNVVDDPGFLEGINYGIYKYEYSQEFLDDLEEMYYSFPKNTVVIDKGFLTKSEFRDRIEKTKKEILEVDPKQRAEEDHLAEKYYAIKAQINDAESQKEWLIKIVGSKKYFDRLVKETGSESYAKWAQRARLNRLKSNEYFLSNDSVESKKGALGHVTRVEEDGFYKYPAFLSHERYISKEEQENNFTPMHEFEHQSTIDILVEETESLLINKVEFDRLTDREHEDNYYLEPDEIMARKRVLDYQLDKLLIKEYQENFTEDHYQKIKKLQEEGKLDRDADLFFRMYEKDSLMLIMNTVAETISAEEVNSSLDGSLA